MKIQTIEIRNYKAFYGNYKIEVGGKNLFIYGENGSGKSSLYYALKDYTTENFWTEIISDIKPKMKSDVEKYRALVLNAFSHYNTERHEIKTELADAIKTVEDLTIELRA